MNPSPRPLRIRHPNRTGIRTLSKPPVSRCVGELVGTTKSESSMMNDSNGRLPGERKERRGFASMTPEKQREIASKGGRAAHQKGTAHEWTSDEARSAGRKGGQISRGGRGRLVGEQPATTGEERVDASDAAGGFDGQ
jgi:general stress protein YciG